MSTRTVWIARPPVEPPCKKDFTKKEWQVIQRHKTPESAQRFLRAIPYNHELEGETCYSFRRVLREDKAHCLEGALAAATILEQHGYPPVLMSIESQDSLDHVLLVFKRNGLLGSVARSRDIGLHGRKPVFRNLRDLVMSYFDPYVDTTGKITGYAVASLYELGNYDWRLSMRNVRKVEQHLQEVPHRPVPSLNVRYKAARLRYLEFHKRYPDRSPDYFENRAEWL